MASQDGVLVYAELLSNIRQVSVVASLPSQADASTTAEVLSDGLRLTMVHQGHSESITLPAHVLAVGPLPVLNKGGHDLSWRLPVAPTEAKLARFSLESQAVPWTATDVIPGSFLHCRRCGSEFVSSDTAKVWKDLPSENWAEMMEFWHCHKPHDHNQHDANSLADKGYGANSAIAAQSGVGFVDLTSFLLSESDCKGLAYSSSTIDAGFDQSSLALESAAENKMLKVFCKKCETEVGIFNTATSSVTLFKWKIACQTVAQSAKPPTITECLAATLMSTISRSGSSKSVIAPQFVGSPGSQEWRDENIYIWVLNPNVVYSSSSCDRSKVAMKILYRKINAEEGNKLVENLSSDVQEISLPLAAIETALGSLAASSQLLRKCDRTLKEWSVGLLERWEPI